MGVRLILPRSVPRFFALEMEDTRKQADLDQTWALASKAASVFCLSLHFSIQVAFLMIFTLSFLPISRFFLAVHIPDPWFLRWSDENSSNSTYLSGLLWQLNEVTCYGFEHPPDTETPIRLLPPLFPPLWLSPRPSSRTSLNFTFLNCKLTQANIRESFKSIHKY